MSKYPRDVYVVTVDTIDFKLYFVSDIETNKIYLNTQPITHYPKSKAEEIVKRILSNPESLGVGELREVKVKTIFFRDLDKISIVSNYLAYNPPTADCKLSF